MPARAADVTRSGGGSAEAWFFRADGCIETTMQVIVAEAASGLLDVGEESDSLLFTLYRRDACTNTDLMYVVQTEVEPDGFTVDGNLASAALTTSFDTVDRVSGLPVHFDLNLSWQNIGTRTFSTRQHTRTHGSDAISSRWFSLDSWSASVDGSVSDGTTDYLAGASPVGSLSSDHTAGVFVDRLRLLQEAAAADSGANSQLDGNVALARWSEIDETGCIESATDVMVVSTALSGTLFGDRDSSEIYVTLSRFDTCADVYLEWISTAVELSPDELDVRGGGRSVTVGTTIETTSSVTLEPVSLRIDVSWAAVDGADATWESFSLHQVTPTERINYATKTSSATVDA